MFCWNESPISGRKSDTSARRPLPGSSTANSSFSPPPFLPRCPLTYLLSFSPPLSRTRVLRELPPVRRTFAGQTVSSPGLHDAQASPPPPPGRRKAARASGAHLGTSSYSLPILSFGSENSCERRGKAGTSRFGSRIGSIRGPHTVRICHRQQAISEVALPRGARESTTARHRSWPIRACQRTRQHRIASVLSQLDRGLPTPFAPSLLTHLRARTGGLHSASCCGRRHASSI